MRESRTRFVLSRGTSPLRILCLGAHADDLEIGCGGTLLHLMTGEGCQVDWVVFSAEGQRRGEALGSAEALLSDSAGEITLHNFRDGFFPAQVIQLKEAFEELAARADPDLILTHCREELHQDHRAVAELTWQTFRRHPILEYEVPKYDGAPHRPNVYFPLSESEVTLKIDHLMKHFPSQHSRHWYDAEAFRSCLRLRGVEAGCRFAEAFVGRKLLLSD